jgi:hypothetical protein
MDNQMTERQVDDGPSDNEPISDEELLVLAKKGSARLRWKFRYMNDDLLGESFQAAVIARNRGLTRGGVVLSVQGRCKNYIKANLIHTESDIVLERMGSKIKVEEQWISEIRDLVTDIADEFEKHTGSGQGSGQGHRVHDGWLKEILRLTAEGYTHREIEEKTGIPYQDVANRLEYVGHTLARKRRYARYRRALVGS